MISAIYAQGTTNGNARQGRGGLDTRPPSRVRAASRRWASTSTATRWDWTPGSGWGRSRSIRPSCTSSVTGRRSRRPRFAPQRRDRRPQVHSGHQCVVHRCARRLPARAAAPRGAGRCTPRVTAAATTPSVTDVQRHHPLLPAADDGHGIPGRLGHLAHVAGYRLPQRLERGWRPDRISGREHRLGQVRAHAARRQGHLRHHPGAERHGRCEWSLDGREGGSRRHCRWPALGILPQFAVPGGGAQTAAPAATSAPSSWPRSAGGSPMGWPGTTSSATCSWARRSMV